MMRGTSHYRADIDGLRAVAVLAVVAYHAAPSLVRGGYVGVDVFFVISGFLITTIILRERDAGEFSLVNFYARRVRRLFPALVVVLIATCLIGWFYLLPNEFVALGKHMQAGAAYFINFTLRWESGYFDAAAESKPLLHLWSLGVEEQFYIFWPLLVVFVRERRTLLFVIAVLMAVSFGWGLYALSKNQASAFYYSHYRVWELGSGALLAATALYRPDRLSIGARAASILSVLGLALIIGSVVCLAERSHYPGFYALLPVTGAVLLIAAGSKAIVNRALLARPVFVFIGLISYPLYLWHWPLLSFAYTLGVKSDPVVLTAIVALSLALAVATYYFVERPLQHVKAPLMTAGLVAATAVIGLVGTTAYAAWLQPRLSASVYQDLSAAKNDWAYPKGLTADRTARAIRLRRVGEGSNAVLYLGDSNVEQFWPRVQWLRDNGLSNRPIIFATLGGCAPIPGLHLETRADCDRFTDEALKLAKDPSISTVVISAAWLAYFDSADYKVVGFGPTLRNTPGWDEGFKRLDRVIRGFTAEQKAVWVILGIPRGGTLGPNMQRHISGDVSSVSMYVDRQASWGPIQAKLKEVAKAAGALTIDPMPLLCERDICPGRTGEGAIMYMDGAHLRSSYVREHADFIDQTLEIVTGAIGH